MNLSIHVPTMRGLTETEVNKNLLYPKSEVVVKQQKPNLGYLPWAQYVVEEFGEDILGYIHDDLTILESDWEKWIFAEFLDPTVAVCGFGGAKAVGHPDIYKIPYHFSQLARRGFISNMIDAEKHGERVTVPTDVAFLDSMAIFIRREFLVSLGGWPVERYAPSHMSDLWICLQALRHGFRVRMVPISIEHTSGGSGPDYPEWCKTTKWGSDAAMHQHNHRMIYEEFADILPVEAR